MLKSEIRKLALAQRSALSEAQLLSLNEKLLAQFKKLDFSAIKSIHLFLPIIQKKEPDTFLFIDWLQHAHPFIKIVVPKADFQSGEMSHYAYFHQDDLVHNAYHIPEPQHAEPFVGEIDLVIVPLLAFDEKGYRVGYGKGFYDRFLQNSNAQKIGLSFFGAISSINDVHLNDIRLDQCITPDGIVDFR
ncbi:MAG: 5-formyltetrahydrofolate cyclo-ligase [Pedobacter sp.]|nr:5-formyltetrahydrofolate cyclo-ligase [Pedobacter sp.]